MSQAAMALSSGDDESRWRDTGDENDHAEKDAAMMARIDQDGATECGECGDTLPDDRRQWPWLCGWCLLADLTR